jgi:hypothetical protein
MAMSYRKRRSSHSYGNRPSQKLFQVISLPVTSSPHSFRVQKWEVRSHSDPNKYYTVSLRKDGVYECSCPHWIYRHKECKHIREVKRQTQTQTPKATPKVSNNFFMNEDGVKQYTLL